MLILTDEDILQDIKDLEKRIQDARDKLVALPETVGTWQARKNIMGQRRILLDEIAHVLRLISIAEEAITDV
jgi:hypothetical protein